MLLVFKNYLRYISIFTPNVMLNFKLLIRLTTMKTVLRIWVALQWVRCWYTKIGEVNAWCHWLISIPPRTTRQHWDCITSYSENNGNDNRANIISRNNSNKQQQQQQKQSINMPSAPHKGAVPPLVPLRRPLLGAAQLFQVFNAFDQSRSTAIPLNYFIRKF